MRIGRCCASGRRRPAVRGANADVTFQLEDGGGSIHQGADHRKGRVDGRGRRHRRARRADQRLHREGRADPDPMATVRMREIREGEVPFDGGTAIQDDLVGRHSAATAPTTTSASSAETCSRRNACGADDEEGACALRGLLDGQRGRRAARLAPVCHQALHACRRDLHPRGCSWRYTRRRAAPYSSLSVRAFATASFRSAGRISQAARSAAPPGRRRGGSPRAPPGDRGRGPGLDAAQANGHVVTRPVGLLDHPIEQLLRRGLAAEAVEHPRELVPADMRSWSIASVRPSV